MAFKTHPALVGLEPRFGFAVFSRVLTIPRRSGQEDGVVAMAQEWGDGHKWPVTTDGWKNACVHVPGTPGYEDAPSTTIQGHSDMVYVPDDDATVATAIDVEVVDGCVQTKGQKRTLGADNSAFIALAFNAAETCAVHGPLEILITSREEDDLGGAENWNPAIHGMKSRRLINIDTPEFGKIAVMSAGFQDVEAILPIVRESEPAKNCFRIALSGLLGGHSGDNVNEGRGNAIKLMAVLEEKLPTGTRLVSLIGGSAGNSIPAEACIEVSIPDNAFGQNWQASLEEYAAYCRNLLRNPAIQLSIESFETVVGAFTAETHDHAFAVIREIPDGVKGMSTLQGNLPELSTTIALIRHKDDGLHFSSIVRGAVETSMVELAESVRVIYQKCGCEAAFGSHSNSWIQEPGSSLVVATQEAFRKIGVEPELKGYHCCLELAALIGVGENRRYDSAVSFGAQVYDEHAVTERMDVESFRKASLVLEILLEKIAKGEA